VFCTDDKAARGGFTLVEILITIAILGILVVLAVGNFGGLNEKYKVEAETKQLYADLMDARGRAMQRNRVFFVRFSGTGYATYEDTNTPPDGNGTWDNTADTRVANVTVAHTITTSLPGGANAFEFNRNGIASVTGNIRFSSTAIPDYDCITIRQTRIKMGQYIGGLCVEK
jgi:type IV fimbrial biogenesis protein FimT